MKAHDTARERGVALIIVLTMLAIAALLSASAVTMSQTAAMESYSSADQAESVYLAESAASRAVWLLLNSRAKNRNGNMESPSEELLEDESVIMADASLRTIQVDGQSIDITLSDMLCGLDISGLAPDRSFSMLGNDNGLDSELKDRTDVLRARLYDYVDSDSLVRVNGLEASGYEMEKLAPLPRNRPMQFREEALWIPGLSELFKPDRDGILNCFQLIPLNGMPQLRGRINLFSAPIELIQSSCTLSDQETAQTTRSLELWRNERKPVAETLDGTLLAKLKHKFATTESGYYTLTVRTPTGRTLVCSFYLYFSIPPSGIKYYQFQLL